VEAQTGFASNLEAAKVVSKYITVINTQDFVGLEVQTENRDLIGKSVTYQVVYEVLSLDGIMTVHSQQKALQIKFAENKCSLIDFTMPSLSGIEFTLFRDGPQYVDVSPDFGNEDASECDLEYSFVGVTHLPSLGFVDSKLYFDRDYNGARSDETVMGAKIKLCIAEGNCKETEAFTLEITSPCRTATVSKEEIGRIATQSVPYLGSRSVKISSAPWSNSVSRSLDTALYPEEQICGEYSYVISSCTGSVCSPVTWATASTDSDGGVVLEFNPTTEQRFNTDYELVFTVRLDEY
jgi:hypothetical protein